MTMAGPSFNPFSQGNHAKHVGGNSYPEGKPVCKPVVPGRRPKPLEGPVHPGFAGKPKPPKKPTMPVGGVVVRADQNNDLYAPLSKGKSIKNKKK